MICFSLNFSSRPSPLASTHTAIYPSSVCLVMFVILAPRLILLWTLLMCVYIYRRSHCGVIDVLCGFGLLADSERWRWMGWYVLCVCSFVVALFVSLFGFFIPLLLYSLSFEIMGI